MVMFTKSFIYSANINLVPIRFQGAYSLVTKTNKQNYTHTHTHTHNHNIKYRLDEKKVQVRKTGENQKEVFEKRTFRLRHYKKLRV